MLEKVKVVVRASGRECVESRKFIEFHNDYKNIHWMGNGEGIEGRDRSIHFLYVITFVQDFIFFLLLPPFFWFDCVGWRKYTKGERIFYYLST